MAHSLGRFGGRCLVGCLLGVGDAAAAAAGTRFFFIRVGVEKDSSAPALPVLCRAATFPCSGKAKPSRPPARIGQTLASAPAHAQPAPPSYPWRRSPCPSAPRPPPPDPAPPTPSRYGCSGARAPPLLAPPLDSSRPRYRFSAGDAWLLLV
jgi:hypothetical protein